VETMKKLFLTLCAIAALSGSAFAGRYVYIEDQDDCSFDQYEHQQQLEDMQNRLDEINQRLDFEATQDFIYYNWQFPR
jgi:hypothetical protein